MRHLKADGHGSDALERVYVPPSRKAREADGQPPRNEALPFALMLIDSHWKSFESPRIGNEVVDARTGRRKTPKPSQRCRNRIKQEQRIASSGKCPTKWTDLARQHGILPSILDTGTNFPGQNRFPSGTLALKSVNCVPHRERNTPLECGRRTRMSSGVVHGRARSTRH